MSLFIERCQHRLEPNWSILNQAEDHASESLRSGACLNAHGMYETERFVLRLSPLNHQLVGDLASGVHSLNALSAEHIQAYSTYIHETVHWWQHIGSTSGLLFSLSYLGQSLVNLTHLRAIIRNTVPKKSIKSWIGRQSTEKTLLDESIVKNANIVVNNAVDIGFYKTYAYDPKGSIYAVANDRYFESIGHSYHIAYGTLASMLGRSIDENFSVLPNPESWEKGFIDLRLREHEGFYWGSPIRVPPFGIRAIYEGQARFIQLQFLNRTFSQSPSMQQWIDMGYMETVYGEAFFGFLDLSGLEIPDKIEHPIVGLFLLVCDLAINPTRGFLCDIIKFESFVEDVDVGVRFVKLCQAIQKNHHFASAIKEYSNEEYVTTSDALAKCADYDNILSELSKFITEAEVLSGAVELMEEHDNFRFKLDNINVRVILSHYLSFVKDKIAKPEFFCWPGVHMVGPSIRHETEELWLRHLSLFTDRADKTGVYPRLWPNREEKDIIKMFHNFFNSMAMYDLSHQWVMADGPFSCQYDWLSENYDPAVAYQWADSAFKQAYGISLSDVDTV